MKFIEIPIISIIVSNIGYILWTKRISFIFFVGSMAGSFILLVGKIIYDELERMRL